MQVSTAQWVLMTASCLILILVVPYSRTVLSFFKGNEKNGREPNLFLLTSSLVISWIFAKSITNAADLGQQFGLAGGVAYGTYYFSFLVAGVLIFRLRTKGGFKSIHHFLQNRFGKGVVGFFSLLICIRLFNEVWSNSMVIGSYFGEHGETAYYGSILVFTVLTLVYVLKGGMRGSLFTDLIQFILFAVLLVVILGIMLPKDNFTISDYASSGTWSLGTGVNLLLVAFIQVFSYPFHDPVMTDRGFVSSPQKTLKAFLLAGAIGFVLILLFSFVGIYAKLHALEGTATIAVARVLGPLIMVIMNFIMITSAASTLDSTFTSFSKLTVLDLSKKEPTIRKGRLAMIVIAIAGTVPIFFNPEVLLATTVSGTMVLGLAPIFIFWNRKVSKWSFYAPNLFAVGLGVVFAIDMWPEDWVWFPGKYGDLLSINIVGTVLVFALYFMPTFIRKPTLRFGKEHSTY